ncbi:50S ribosomal protein L5 [Candidatus Vidania fulgoroideorum]
MSYSKKYLEVCKHFVIKKKYNVMEVPKLIKIVINMSMGYKAFNKDYLNDSIKELKIISKQKPLIIKAKKSISEFGIKKGFPISLKVTLRKKNMYFFYKKFLNSLKNLNEFEGFSKNSFDYYGNYNLGIKDHTLFDDFFNFKKSILPKGLNITIVIKNKNVNDSYYLLKKYNFPFK